MRFLVDAQLPPALVRLLREHGHTAEHVTKIGPADAPDRDIWRYALEHKSVIVTKDEDFADMVANRSRGARRRLGPHRKHPPGGVAGMVRTAHRADRRDGEFG